MLPPARPHLQSFSNSYQLEMKYSNIMAYRGHSHPSHHSIHNDLTMICYLLCLIFWTHAGTELQHTNSVQEEGSFHTGCQAINNSLCIFCCFLEQRSTGRNKVKERGKTKYSENAITILLYTLSSVFLGYAFMRS